MPATEQYAPGLLAARTGHAMQEPEPGPNGMSLAYIEGLYEDYLRDPKSVSKDWSDYFSRFNGSAPLGVAPKLRPGFRHFSLFNPPGHLAVDPASLDHANRLAVVQHCADSLIRAYRLRGHRMACLDALGIDEPDLPELSSQFHDLSDGDLDLPVSYSVSRQVKERMTPREIITRMQNTYCRSIGVEFMHIDDLHVRDWIQERIEPSENRIRLSRETQIRIFEQLTDAITFEEFIQHKYVGAKSFSLEGAESLIPLLSLAIEKAGEHQMNEVVIAMPHRGRLNVLANIMRKDPAQIFREYEDKDPDQFIGRGDVKYHLGYHTNWETLAGRNVHLALCFNPSHLEFVNPVALGRLRSMQDRTNDINGERSMGILIHGDAAFAGEGVVQETLNMSQLHAYRTGGTLHIIVNNQIGFTTRPQESRSTLYCTDVAKMLQSPIFHVDGEDPEAVAQVIGLAMDFRAEFRRDVVIDMYCYRKRGHNEGDEPMFTQPLMYKEIAKRKSVRDNYLERLTAMGEITKDDAEAVAERRKGVLEKALEEARETPQIRPPSELRDRWTNFQGGPDLNVVHVDSGVPERRLKHLIKRLCTVPDGFNPHPKLQKLLDTRLKMATGSEPIDWAVAEQLAFATLATEKARVRLTGQDSQRGTFSHRHAVLHDFETDEEYCPLQHVSDDQAPVEIFNSPLTETAVLGFEYGYSLARPDGLVCWEAQFGDFSNAAQVIMDQFISSAEDKWRSLSGLVMMLPHGFEGMGPEHSSARLERFLGLAAEDNMQICVPTTPAQMFHLLRRQVVRPWRKPLVIMTPKSLLRHPRCVSNLEDFTHGRFKRILPDADGRVDDVERILMCSGRIYYDLIEHREKHERDDVAIIRVEQLYPLQPPDLDEILQPYADETPLYWVQDEPENMGAWRRMKGKFGEHLLGRFPLTGVCRPASASPATGSSSSHKIEQSRILHTAFGSEKTSWY